MRVAVIGVGPSGSYAAIYPIKEGIALMYMKRRHVLAGEHFHIEKRGSVIFVPKNTRGSDSYRTGQTSGLRVPSLNNCRREGKLS